MNKQADKIFIVAFLLIASLLLHFKEINKFPDRYHAWAQADRYALSVGFIKNGFDFFHPRTNIFNAPFPWSFEKPGTTAITAVDFPIHDFIPALIMKVFRTRAPWCFHLYVLLYSLIGLFFLYLLSNEIFQKKTWSVFVLLFAMTSPVFIRYQSGFLPTIPSLANLFIGLYFYTKYFKYNKIKDFFFTLFFISLAALSRTPFSIFLIALLCVDILSFTKQKEIKTYKIYTYISSAIIITTYFLYNNYLRNTYGSAFLNYPLPAQNFNEWKDLLKETCNTWGLIYFSIWHYIAGILILVIILFLIVKKKNIIINHLQKKLFQFAIISFIGVFAYFTLMIKQFPVHDYYFLDTFYPLCILFLILFLKIILQFDKFKKLSFISMCLFSVLLIYQCFQTHAEEKNDPLDLTLLTKNDFHDSERFLDSLHIPQSAKFLNISVFSPNISFNLMNREGFVILMSNTTKEHLESAIDWNYDYIVIQDRYLITNVIDIYPDIINKIEKICGNGKISVYKKKNNNSINNFYSFFKLDSTKCILMKHISFDTLSDSAWSNINIINQKKKVGITTKKNECGRTLKLDRFDTLKLKNKLLLVNAKIFALDSLKDAKIILSIETENQTIYYQNFKINNYKKNIKEWIPVQFIFTALPESQKPSRLNLYIWNAGRNTFYYTDLSACFY